MQFLYFLQQALVWLITVYWIYQLVISLFALVKIKDKPYIVDKKHKFLAIIPAHNEAEVVGNLITSLQNQTYDSKDYDLYVIADNCTDKTEEIATELGIALDTNNLKNLKEIAKLIREERKTKNFKIGLNWKNLTESREMIFDI